jgi:hypothetical protein
MFLWLALIVPAIGEIGVSSGPDLEFRIGASVINCWLNRSKAF